jgi:hypothetical protein
MAHDVFISHAHEDKTIADMVCARLEQQGVRCWMAPRDIQLGADWGGAIVAAIRSSRLMVLVFSDHANGSRHIPRELERAIDIGIPIIPFRIEDVAPRGSLEYNLSSVHWLDAVTPPVEAHVKQLAQTLRAMLGERPVAPTGPAGRGQAQSDDTPRSAGPDQALVRSARRATGSSRRPALFAVGVLIAALCAIGAYVILSGGRGAGQASAATGPGSAPSSGRSGTTSRPTSVALPDSSVPDRGARAAPAMSGAAPPPAAKGGDLGTAAKAPTSTNGSKEPAGTSPAGQLKAGPPTRPDRPSDATAVAANCARLNERASVGEPLTAAEQTFLTRQCRN